MQARDSLGEQAGRTFTEAAWRVQIVAAAIEVIVEQGYAAASFAQIARRAGLSSTGLISYHFAGRGDLVRQVVTDVLTEFAEFVRPVVDAETNAAGVLRAWWEANVAFMRDHRAQLIVLMEIRSNAKELGAVADAFEHDLQALEQLFREGQEAGEFRTFDPRVMAVAVRSVRDGLLREFAARPELDLDACARDLVMLFDLATRRGD
jgi:AcrR family transcriptional regulator